MPDLERWAGLLARQVAAADAPVAPERVIGGHRESPFLTAVVDRAVASGYVMVKHGKLVPGETPPPPFTASATRKHGSKPTKAKRDAKREADARARAERVAAAAEDVERAVAAGPWPVQVKTLSSLIGHSAADIARAVEQLESEGRVVKISHASMHSGLYPSAEAYESARAA